VSARDSEERVALHGASVERFDGHLGKRQEVALGGVENVRDATAVAVAGERHQTRDAVPRGLDTHALLAEVQVTVRGVLSHGVRLHICSEAGGVDGAHAVIIARLGRPRELVRLRAPTGRRS
jgi:hypothetical protein